MTVQLWKFPNPWDYHEQGAYVVAAETKDEAVAILEAEAARTGAARAEWDQAKAAECYRIWQGAKPGRFDSDPGWKAWRTWLGAHPTPDVVSLPSGYHENVEPVGLVYSDGGCDD